MAKYIVSGESGQDFAYRSGEGLDAFYAIDYADIGSTPTAVTNLAVTIHETGKLLVGRLFPDWRDYNINGRTQRHVFGSKPRVILVESAYYEGKYLGNSLHVGSAAINLIAGDVGLRFGIDHCEDFDDETFANNRANWFHISQYRVGDAAKVLRDREGELTQYLDNPDAAERTSLVSIYTPLPEHDGRIRVERHQIGQEPASTDLDPTVLVGNTFEPLENTTELLNEVAGQFLSMTPIHYRSWYSRLLS